MWKDVRQRLDEVRGNIGEAVLVKFDGVAQRNVGLSVLNAVNAVLRNDVLSDDAKRQIANYSASDFALFKYAPVTSCEAERTFSRFKSVLRSNRESFMIQNLLWHLVALCNP